MAAMRYLFYPHPTIFAFSSSLLLNLFFHKCHWLAIISKCQTKKLNNNETLNVSLQFYLSVTLIHYVLLFTIMISCLLFQYLLFTSYCPMPHLCKCPELLSSCWEVSSGFLVHRNMDTGLQQKSTALLTQLFEKLVNNKLVNNFEKYSLFSDFEYGFRSSWLTGYNLADVVDRISRVFIGLQLPELYHLLYLRLSTECGMLIFFTNASQIEFQDEY